MKLYEAAASNGVMNKNENKIIMFELFHFFNGMVDEDVVVDNFVIP